MSKQKNYIALHDTGVIPKLSPELMLMKGKAAAYCFEECGFNDRQTLRISGCFDDSLGVEWNSLSEIDRNSFSDNQESTEWGAEAIAFIVINQLTDFDVISRSYKSTGFDYTLQKKDCSLFQGEIAKLEVSGILKLRRDGDLMTRIKQKIKQATKSHQDIPLYVVVTAFSGSETGVHYVEGN